jgi:hypothetical protein
MVALCLKDRFFTYGTDGWFLAQIIFGEGTPPFGLKSRLAGGRLFDRLDWPLFRLFANRARDLADDGIEGLKHDLDAVADKKRKCRQR